MAKISKAQQEKIRKIMREFKQGELHIGKSKKIVRDRRQAIAIALSQVGLSKRQRKKRKGKRSLRKRRRKR